MNFLRFGRWMGLPALALLAACATAGHPCFNQRAMFADKSTACQYGREYRCDNGDWIAYKHACVETAPEVAALPLVPGSCEFAGISFASGSASCQAGSQYRCENGRWADLALPCSAGDAPIRVVPRGDACNYGGTSVASSVTVCQSGTTFLCNDGRWVDLGTFCR